MQRLRNHKPFDFELHRTPFRRNLRIDRRGERLQENRLYRMKTREPIHCENIGLRLFKMAGDGSDRGYQITKVNSKAKHGVK